MDRKRRLEIVEKFDPDSCRQYLNECCTVLHSHHYAALISQLADDADDFDGIYHLRRAAEETFHEVLGHYFHRYGTGSLEERIAVTEQYWETVGMGQIRFKCVEKYAVCAEMEFSHVDQGWLEKWGRRDKQVNFITQGYVAAAAALFTGRLPGNFTVREERSLVAGHDVSVFKAVLG
ncbi:MAG: hypothetical protein ABIL58_24880 [Pseudomonadota bacterium]